MEYRDLFETALAAFTSTPKKEEACLYSPRAIIDQTVTGWSGHFVARIIGFLGLKKTQNGPSFELLINSSRSTEDDPYCNPFHVIMLVNNNAAAKRWERLKPLKRLPASIAYPQFYGSSYDSPDTFLINYRKEHKKDPGPNSLRLLNGLKFLALKRMKAQTIGNCWMKQNKRQVLAILFIETLTRRPELEMDAVWKISLSLYKRWSKYTRKELLNMVQAKAGLSVDLMKLAEAKILKKDG